ncbi:MAG: hypothetical protein KF831_06940 [Acidobacteria bacterium]|nr:hypothetical protein [Acidobacteriota bacterium]
MYNAVQIEDLYLTSDGTSGGLPCRVEIDGIARLRPAFRRTVVLPIEGKPFAQLFDNLIGEQLTMSIFVLKADEYEDLITIIDAADAGDGEIQVRIEGETGDLDLQCVLESFSQQGEFDEDRIPAVTLVWRIAAVNPPPEP